MKKPKQVNGPFKILLDRIAKVEIPKVNTITNHVNVEVWEIDHLLKIIMLKKCNFKGYKVAIVSNEGSRVKSAVILLVLNLF